MKTNRSNKGFTLVEIMIVVVIIGLLSAAAQQYFLENGVSVAAWGDLVGPTAYIKTIATVAGETYPASYNQTDASIVATGSNVANKPNISFTN